MQRHFHLVQLVFFSSLLTVLLGFGNHVNAKAIELDKIVAIVDNDIVMQSELENRIRSLTNRLTMQGTPLPPDDILKERILEQLILESIQLQLAERAGIRVSDQQLNMTIANIAKSNKLTLEQFEAQLIAEGETYAGAREQIRRELILTRVQQREVDRRVRVTEQEIEGFLASKQGRVQSGMEYLLGHILVSIPPQASESQKEEAKSRAQSILQELKDGADFRKTALTKSDGRHALEGGEIGWRKENELPSIAADVIPNLAVNEPSELLETGSGLHIVTVLEKRGGQEQIIEQRHVRHILIAPSEIRTLDEAKESITLLHDRIMNGDDFGEIAKSHSDDPVSAIDGGDLDWVSPGQMVPAFEAKMKETPVGEVSEPFRSKFGWHILEVLETRQQDIGELLQSNQARRAIHRRKYEEELSNWLAEIKGEAFIEIKGKEDETTSEAQAASPSDQEEASNEDPILDDESEEDA